MSRGDVFDSPFEWRHGDSLSQLLDRCLHSSLPSDTTYEALSNMVLRMIREFSAESKKSLDSRFSTIRDPEMIGSIQKFCKFVETSLNELQIRLSRKAFDFTFCQIMKWTKICPENLLNDLFRALGAILYGAGTMSDPHKEALILGEAPMLKQVCKFGFSSHLIVSVKNLRKLTRKSRICQLFCIYFGLFQSFGFALKRVIIFRFTEIILINSFLIFSMLNSAE